MNSNSRVLFRSATWTTHRDRLFAAVLIAGVSVLMTSASGCDEPKKSREPITKRKTQDIRDSAAEQAKGAAVRPVGTGGLGVCGANTALGASYGAGISVGAAQEIKSGVEAYFAENFDYPKSHQDFMDNVVKKYNIRLPVLPGNQQYAYNVEKHILEIVSSDPAATNQPQGRPGIPAGLPGLPGGS